MIERYPIPEQRHFGTCMAEWRDIVHISGIDEETQSRLYAAFDAVDPDAEYEMGRMQLLRELSSTIDALNPDILKADEEMKRFARTNEKPELPSRLSERDHMILTLFRELRDDMLKK